MGLHPDAVTLLAELFVKAARRTQLVVTTHSHVFVDALTDHPEYVVVCEHDEVNGTRMRRLDSETLQEWLRDYTLGELWRKGEIGGNRW